jgi:tRNA modification GTPase
MWNHLDLIVAPATCGGYGARAIVRLSGDGVAPLLQTLLTACGDGFTSSARRPRVVAATFAEPLAAEWGALDVEVLFWPGPAGPTGEPLAEVQLPASGPLAEAFVTECCRRGARLARGGEFSLRSFLAGRLDLLQAEAVLAVVEAATPAELSAALDRMAGGAGRQLQAARDALLDLVADIEATIDFADERSPDALPVVEVEFWGGIERRLTEALGSLGDVAAYLGARSATAAGDLPRAVLVGRPNVGKSSLFNALVGGEAALVADEAGTTRDWIAARLEDRSGACMLVDLAGVDGTVPAAAGAPSVAELDQAAAAAAATEIARADLVVVCRDANEPERGDLALIPTGVRRIDVVTRCDQSTVGQRPTPPQGRLQIVTSSVAGIGIDELRSAILEAAGSLPGKTSAATLRMGVGVDSARAAIEAARTIAAGPPSLERDEAVVAGCLHRAAADLGEITGAEMGNDIIDRIFSRHCIGK